MSVCLRNLNANDTNGTIAEIIRKHRSTRYNGHTILYDNWQWVGTYALTMYNARCTLHYLTNSF